MENPASSVIGNPSFPSTAFFRFFFLHRLLRHLPLPSTPLPPPPSSSSSLSSFTIFGARLVSKARGLGASFDQRFST